MRDWLEKTLNQETNIEDWMVILAWIIVGLSILVFTLSIGLIILWIYYSWIKRNNSQNYTGKDITDYIFQTTNTNVQVINSFMYVKYWNYNKKRGTHKLRPWTFSRRSIWTMMEASQQAYATTIRSTKGKQFWLIFRLPGIIRIGGLIIAATLAFTGFRTLEESGMNYIAWTWFSFSATVLLISYTIADVGRVFVLWKNVVPILKNSGLTDDELKAINRIYFWRMIYSLIIVVLEIIKLILQIASKVNERKK